MDLQAIESFVEVMRAGSFAAAARQRAVDPSAISRLILGLESELGVRLFQRTTRRLVATEAGSVFFERMRPLLDEMERALHDTLSIIKLTLESGAVVPGGGAVETALNIYLENFATTLVSSSCSNSTQLPLK